VSYSSLLRVLNKVGENHDAMVNSWKVAIVESMRNSEVCHTCLAACHELLQWNPIMVITCIIRWIPSCALHTLAVVCLAKLASMGWEGGGV
jgi:hypothetical protein